MKYIVCWKDGSLTENLTYKESMALINERDGEWTSVYSEMYGTDCSEKNVKIKQQIWGAGNKYGK